jgi:hypothetical protein
MIISLQAPGIKGSPLRYKPTSYPIPHFGEGHCITNHYPGTIRYTLTLLKTRFKTALFFGVD